MLKSQTLLLEQSTAREKVNAFLAMEDDQLTTEQRSELGSLTERLQNLEVEYRAALTVEGDKIEIAASRIRKAASSASWSLVPALARSSGPPSSERSSTDGKTAELQQHLGLSENELPLALLRGSEDQLEVRSTGATHAAPNVGQTQAPPSPQCSRIPPRHSLASTCPPSALARLRSRF